MAAGMVVKGEGKANDLLERVRQDDAFKAIHDKIDSLVDPMLFIGRCPEQVHVLEVDTSHISV
jgi:adenylosuccinate lyase